MVLSILDESCPELSSRALRGWACTVTVKVWWNRNRLLPSTCRSHSSLHADGQLFSKLVTAAPPPHLPKPPREASPIPLHAHLMLTYSAKTLLPRATRFLTRSDRHERIVIRVLCLPFQPGQSLPKSICVFSQFPSQNLNLHPPWKACTVARLVGPLGFSLWPVWASAVLNHGQGKSEKKLREEKIPKRNRK